MIGFCKLDSMFTAPFEMYLLNFIHFNFRLYGVNAFSDLCKVIRRSHWWQQLTQRFEKRELEMLSLFRSKEFPLLFIFQKWLGNTQPRMRTGEILHGLKR